MDDLRTESMKGNNVAVSDSRVSNWRPGRGVLWQSWSINGEVCIKGLFPPFAGGGARLAHCLTWILRSFASRCRETYNGTGAIIFTYAGARTPTTLAWALSLGFNLALQDPKLIRQHVRHRGGDPAACPWPGFWLEGSTVEYFPLRIGREARQKLVVLGEQRQVFVSARTAPVTDSVARKWAAGLEVLAGVDEGAVLRLLDDDQECYLVNMFVRVHQQAGGRIRPRPSLEESYLRHEGLIEGLASLADAKQLPLRWHALWRLPSGMSWNDPGRGSWMRYPAVSFAMGVRKLENQAQLRDS